VYDAQRETNGLPDDDVKDKIKRLLEEENERERRANQYLNLVMRRSTKEESDKDRRDN